MISLSHSPTEQPGSKFIGSEVQAPALESQTEKLKHDQWSPNGWRLLRVRFAPALTEISGQMSSVTQHQQSCQPLLGVNLIPVTGL